MSADEGGPGEHVRGERASDDDDDGWRVPGSWRAAPLSAEGARRSLRARLRTASLLCCWRLSDLCFFVCLFRITPSDRRWSFDGPVGALCDSGAAVFRWLVCRRIIA